MYIYIDRCTYVCKCIYIYLQWENEVKWDVSHTNNIGYGLYPIQWENEVPNKFGWTWEGVHTQFLSRYPH